jgi:hypothetical protein
MARSFTSGKLRQNLLTSSGFVNRLRVNILTNSATPGLANPSPKGTGGLHRYPWMNPAYELVITERFYIRIFIVNIITTRAVLMVL